MDGYDYVDYSEWMAGFASVLAPSRPFIRSLLFEAEVRSMVDGDAGTLAIGPALEQPGNYYAKNLYTRYKWLKRGF